MSFFALALIALALFAGPASAESKWIRLNSEHFEMNTSAGEGTARDTLRYFEQIRAFFIETFGDMNKKPLPISIVAFNSEKEYQPYRFNAVADAYYQAGAERDYIVLVHPNSEQYPVVVHEYVHLLTQHAGLHFPLWLNEGIADFYSTLKPTGNKILVGAPPEGRIQQMLQEKWLPVAGLLSVDHNSPFYNEKNKAGILYSEGWALTHMLLTTDPYRHDFNKFVNVLVAKNGEAAFREVYGKSLAQVDRELQGYAHNQTLKGFILPTKLIKDVGTLNAQPLTPFDSKLRLVELLEHPGNEAAAKKAVEELIAMEPKRPEAYALLGYMEWRGNHRDAAVQNFQKAFEAGSRSARMLWDYGRMVQDDPAHSMAAFRRILEDDATRLDVRIEFAYALVRNHQAKDAVEVLQSVTNVTRADAPRFFLVRMIADYDSNDLARAKVSAESLLKYATDDSQKSNAQNMLNMLDHQASSAAVHAAAARLDSEEDVRPTLRRGLEETSVSERIAPPAPKPTMAGTFVELLCDSDKPTLILVVEGVRKRFLIDQPNNVVMQGGSGAAMEMTCGKQKGANIRVEYVAAPAGSGVDGLVRGLDWSDK